MSIAEELQMMSLGIKDVEDTRKDLNRFVEFMMAYEQPGQSQQDWTDSVGFMRSISYETLRRLKCFMMDPDIPDNDIPSDFHHESYGVFKNFYGNERNLYSGRFMIPVQDVYGNVMGFTGWCDDYILDNSPKYLDSINYGYKAKVCGFLGMQDLPRYYKDGYIVICEGPFCYMYMKDHNLPALCSLGSSLSPTMVRIAERFEDKCLIIPDGTYLNSEGVLAIDDSGYKYRKQVHKLLPKARVIQPKFAKDIDDTRKWLKEQKEDGEEIIAEEIRRYLYEPFFEGEYFH